MSGREKDLQKFSIKQLTSTNAQILDRIADGVFDAPIRAEYLQAFLADDRHTMFLALRDNMVVGMVSGVEYFHPDKPAQMWINEVGVGAEHRNSGIGRALTAAIIDYAEQNGCIYAWLGTMVDNGPAQACFAAVPDGEPPQKILMYEWELD